MKRAGVIVGIILIGVAYVVGFWPQHQKAQQTQRQLDAVTIQLEQAQAELRLYGLQHRLLGLIEKTSAKDYGAASALSTQFFDQVRNEEMRRTEPQVKAALESILNQRDSVTAGLAKGDPGTLGVLNALEGVMFNLVDQAPGGAGTAGAGS
ncbi:MAG TPA: hypothetical protein VNJ12_07805 [Candidatus Dormibacteraeota bacterium]|nr:hypothetical protein [Candidatus Dormibacteraeota bacterium]